MVVKLGDNGRAVKEIQQLLKNKGFYDGKIDGDFGPKTEASVKAFQLSKKIKDDGKVGPTTLKYLLEGIDTDRQDTVAPKDDVVKSPPANDTDGKLAYLGSYNTTLGLKIDKAYLDTDEYVKDYGKILPKNLFIHHTAGWDNPYNCINSWNGDDRGRVGTQYVIGGPSIKGTVVYDGVVVECIPNNYIGWHLGEVGNFNASKLSVGIEVNNFGYVTKKDDKFFTYVNTEVPLDQVIDLGYKFRGYQYWHKYSDAQIESLRLLILHIKEIYPTIDITKGLLEELESKTPAEAFEFNTDAYNAKKYGLWTHTNVRKDKFDMSPQPNLIKMIKSLK